MLTWRRMTQGAAAVFAATALLVIIASPSKSDTVLGRWCDKMLPALPKYNRVLAIVVTDEGNVEAQSQFAHGSNLVNNLKETSGGFFEVIDSSSGDCIK